MLEWDGTKLKELRKAQKLTQSDLAEKVGKTFSHISNYERDKKPPCDVLLNFLDIFKVAPEQIAKPKVEKVNA
jgi:transcriptional regulator with XRE-family HTH domain